ncbi:TonB-dependent receptor [Comamonas serinivorans]|uniref:TonB-dependent receptor n=1 Tax=Comamonas serinivorans TaxID=1082851 RepID=A0A1Y0ES68_9BURK|nr:TonB-dependent receptor [Comamonas serinivorans]ARU06525.1 TonB-dependent receptor [Comamonas serinivorans]
MHRSLPHAAPRRPAHRASSVADAASPARLTTASALALFLTLAVPAHAQESAAPAAPQDAPAASTTPAPAAPAAASSATPAALSGVTVRGQTVVTTPVSVLDREQLQLRDTSTLGAALDGEPGVQASHFGAGASRPIMRGMDGPRVQVLSNGAEIQDAASVSPDHAVVTEPLLADRIELLRGPSALLYSAGAIGGVVNVTDERIPTAVPDRPQGRVGLRASSAAREAAGAFSLTAGSGPIAVHVEGAARDAEDYRVGKGWNSARVEGSQARGNTGSVGVSWVGSQGYLGVSAARQTRTYGLPGHSHDIEDCHPHGTHLHCGGHDDHGHDDHGHEDEHGHDHDHDHDHADVPRVRMTSNRYDLRGEWRQPVAGIEAVRIRGGLTRYRHDEVEDGAIATTFNNRANDWRIEAQHAPVAGWRGVFGVEGSQRRFSALGEEAYVAPSTTTRQGLFWMEERQFGAVGVSATLRHDWQRVQAASLGERLSHHGSSLALGATWRFAPEYRASIGFTTASRMPSAEELFARGLHMATRTYELGNAALRPERARNIDLGLAKTAGNTTFSVNLYHNRVGGYIHARTLDALNGVQLLQYSQDDARFTGVEARVQHRLDGRWLGAQWRTGAWADVVHARLANGERLARLAPARAGFTLGAQWAEWDTELEWRLVQHQRKVAEFETATPGYGMLNWRLRYTSAGEQPWQAYVQLNNLTNKLAYVHTSFIKDAAPLMGRSLVVGLSKAF